MNPDIRHHIIVRNRLHKKAKKKNTEAAWRKFRIARNRVISKIRRAKEKMHKKNAAFLKTNQNRSPKAWWKTIKQFYNTKGKQSDLSHPLIVNDAILTTEKDKADALNAFFAAQSTLEDTDQELPMIYPLNKNTLEHINITSNNVKLILENLRPSKASGPDNINPMILKKTATTISPILAHIFNFSLRSGTFPTKWKLANVTPLFKKGDKQRCENYRPISLLSILSKVLERCVFIQVFSFFQENGIITKLQAAYTTNSCTEYQLLEIYDKIITSLDKGKMVRFVFCDISKAFDRVWHKGLLHKLERAGICGSLHKWFESYLTDRSQQVCIKGVKSDPLFINAGVPQGSILGPLLFILYINDITEEVTIPIRLYADDSTMFTIGNNAETMAKDLNENLSHISKWAEKWRVNFNAKKTVSVTFCRRKPDHNVPLYLNGTCIVDKDTHKHLGCTLQSNGRWNKHVEEITNKCQRKLDMLKGLRRKLDRKSLETLFTAYIRPVFEYSSSVWTNCNEGQKQRIEELQRTGIRAITGAIRGTPHHKLYQETGWVNTFERRCRKNLTVYFKINNNLVPEYLRDLLPTKTANKTSYNLRNSQDLSMPSMKSQSYQNSFIPTTTKSWNNLSPATRSITSLRDFKNQWTKHDERIPKYYYTGNRAGQIILSRMRMGCSPLKADLHSMHIINDTRCECGHPYEDHAHYFFDCPRYQHLRDLYNEIDPKIEKDTRTFLYGSREVGNDSNANLFATITKYISKSKRF